MKKWSLVIIAVLFLASYRVSGDTFDGFIRALKKVRDSCGFTASNILDLGANRGLWSSTIKRSVFPTATYFLIEGSSRHEQTLRTLGLPFHIGLVGSRTGFTTFWMLKENVDKDGTGSSIFMENTAAFNELHKRVSINSSIDTLDNIISSKQLGPFQIIKIDVQGAEVDVIKGGRNAFSMAEIVFTEAPIMNYNNGAPGLLELYMMLHKKGYEIFDILDLARDSSQFLLQIDIMWVKKSSKLWNKECTGYPKPIHFAHQHFSRFVNEGAAKD